jgi:hypothetical protein
MNIQESIRMIAKQGTPINYRTGRLCTVDSVDSVGSVAVCIPLEGGAEINCRIQADNQNGLYLKPSIGSVVGIMMDSDFTGEIVCYSKLDSIKMLDGSFGGLTKTQELKTQLDKVNAQLQAVVSSLTSWVPVANDGGAALKTYFAGQIAGKPAGNFASIENSNITHGAP